MEFTQLLKQLKPNPRILFNEEEINGIKARVIDNGRGNRIDFKGAWENTLQLAESYVVEQEFTVIYSGCSVQLNIPLPLVQLDPIDDPPGYIDYPFWTMYSRAVEDRIRYLAFAYGMTKEKRFAEKVKEYLIALSSFTRWFEFLPRGAEGNLSNAHFTIGAAIGYDAIFHTLSNEEKNAIKKAILVKGLQPFGIDFNNYDSHNIIASKRVAMLIGSLAILDNDCKEEVEPFILNSCAYIKNYLDSRMRDPGIEGLLYLNVAARHILMAVDTYHRSTEDYEFLKHAYFNFLPDIFIYTLGTAGKSSFVNFSDSFYSLDISYLMAIIASKNQNQIASWYMNKFSESHLETLLNSNNIPEPMEPENYYENKYSNIFPTIGWASLRSGWKENDHLLAFNASQSAKNHNHFDQNNFILHVAGEWLITNPGYQDYVEGPRREFTIGTIGHNSMLINEVGQSQMGRSKFVDWHTSENFSFVIGEATDAYDTSISQWERKNLHIDKSYFVIVDKVVKKDADGILSFLFHTTAQIYVGDQNILPGEKIEESHIEFVGDKASASLYICYPNDIKKSLEQHVGAKEYGSYLKVVPSENEQLQYVVTIIVPHIVKSEFDYSITNDGSFFSIQVNREKIIDYILVNEDRKSVWQTTSNGTVTFQGEQGWVSLLNDEPMPSKFSVMNGSCLIVQGNTVIETTEAMNISGFFEEDEAKLQLELQKDTKVLIKTVNPTNILINGEKHQNEAAIYHSEKGLLELNLKHGMYVIDLFF
ncbi:heparinase II/III family protein [Psychrobacillus sp.]|uniref:heparinase II/III domain-containing protein n=1 Tax=Psychrobacillus sp. TaxID=1871623 RepID=UPI0028BEF5E0|nr:heparinase II/III family protein [Psychrobacillus sp.]